jgi:hypothetical protein
MPHSSYSLCDILGSQLNKSEPRMIYSQSTGIAVTDFDPYVEWLEIPPELCPPNLYDLLGVPPFSSDPDVIEQAFEIRLKHVRTFQTGPRGKHTQDLLNELAQARLRLLNDQARAEYDRSLRGKIQPPPVLDDSLTESDPPPIVSETIRIRKTEDPASESESQGRAGRRRLSGYYVAGCVVVLVGVYLGQRLLFPGGGGEAEEQTELSAKQATESSRTEKPIVNVVESERGIMPGDNNSFRLDAGNATLDDSHPVVSDATGGQVLEQWQAADSEVRWQIWIKKRGYYEAIVEYNATRNESSKFAVQVDDQYPRKTNLRSADQPSEYFQEEVVVLFHEPGEHEIKFFVEGEIGDFRLRSITLRPNRIGSR